MKKIKITILTLAILSLFQLTNCGPDEKEDVEQLTGVRTPEENKAVIQNIGVEFVQEMSAMEASATTQAAISLGFALNANDNINSGGRLAGIATINKSIFAFASGKISAKGFVNQIHRIYEDDPFTLEDLFDENKGVYDWNATNQEWVTTTVGGDVVQLNFPSVDGGTTNNASMTLQSYTGTYISNPLEADYEGDLPASLLVDLKVDGVKEMEYSFDINYNSNGEPEMIETSLFINPFTLSASVINTTTKVANTIEFKNGSKIIMATATEFLGNFTENTVEAVDEDEDNIPDLITDASFSFALLDLKIAGDIVVEDFYNAVKDLDLYEDAYFDETLITAEVEASGPKLENALNDHTSLTLTYVSSGEKAADIEWYTIIETYEDEWWKEIYVTPGARMVFADESKVDIEDFFSTGFDELESEINNFIDQFSESIDEDLDHIDFGD